MILLLGQKTIDEIMRKDRKRESQRVHEFRNEMNARQRDGETCVDI